MAATWRDIDRGVVLALHGGDRQFQVAPGVDEGPTGTGSGYDEGTVVNLASNFGCTAACHAGSLTNAGAANYNHKLANSGWTINCGDFGSGDCNTCHASASRDHSGATTESVYTHNMHVGSEFIAGACTECHPHDGTSVSPGTGIHGLGGTVNFANKIANSYDYAGSDFGGNCSTNTCHDSDDAEEEWHNISLGADACQDYKTVTFLNTAETSACYTGSRYNASTPGPQGRFLKNRRSNGQGAKDKG